jgi:hypothetical protein
MERKFIELFIALIVGMGFRLGFGFALLGFRFAFLAFGRFLFWFRRLYRGAFRGGLRWFCRFGRFGLAAEHVVEGFLQIVGLFGRRDRHLGIYTDRNGGFGRSSHS